MTTVTESDIKELKELIIKQGEQLNKQGEQLNNIDKRLVVSELIILLMATYYA